MNRAFYPSDPLQSATPMKLDFDSFELAGCHSRAFPSCFDAHSTGAGDCRIGATARRKAVERQPVVPSNLISIIFSSFRALSIRYSSSNFEIGCSMALASLFGLSRSSGGAKPNAPVFFVPCAHCAERILIARSPNLPDEFNVACPKCGRRALYEKSRVRPLSAAPQFSPAR